jgi:carbamoyl-phosphate synthase large subunit
MPARRDLKKILVLGSGAIVIGQACEFDYSGVQAVKALKEEGYEVVLVNPNPATVMTTPGVADAIYLEPLKLPWVEEIIKKERPDALLPTMGGQTALNLALELADRDVLEKWGVEMIGASIHSIRIAEDRGEFKKKARSIGLDTPRSAVVRSVGEAFSFAEETPLPLVIRPSFTLGGLGGSIASTRKQLALQVERALSVSPAGSALLEESLVGWKEFEMEVMRDRMDNAVVVCSIENIDPMGVHTGDSVTVAPVQTLSDKEYQEMRTAALNILRAVGVDCGGSNVQFAVHPVSGRMVIIEMNPRVSRSSALASKATGFPIARAAAKLAVGYTLDELPNEITGKTVSCFEPSLDYVAVKVPRFEMEKFPAEYELLGTQMKSVGESLALGRTFMEALNKAIRAAEIGYEGLLELDMGYDGLDRMLTTSHPKKLFAAYTVLHREGRRALPELARKTSLDPWFLHQMAEQVLFEERLASEPFGEDLLLEAKRFGLSDRRIARVAGMNEKDVSEFREKSGIVPSFHFVDTCAGEFPAVTPYFYSSWGEKDEGEPLGQNAVLILASGPNRIGQGLEFDTCCTLASLAWRERGRKTVIVNSNPETVSTDYNVSDRLYLEPLTTEHVKAVLKKEGIRDVLVQSGGQTPLNMARELELSGARIVGTSLAGIRDAEDRGRFAALLLRLGLRQPRNRMAGSREDVAVAAEEIGYPVLLRPSYVLGGKNMFIAYKRDELEEFLDRGIPLSPESPVLVDQFLEDAFEYDLDALCDGVNVYIAGIGEHIEAAGIHSGDSACVFPVYKSTPEILREMKNAAIALARAICVRGFLNIQFAAKDGLLYVLEVNPRASRTVPFLSKASGVDLAKAAVFIWEGTDLEAQGLVENGFGEGRCTVGWAVKEAVFSFDRFSSVDPLLGPEMRSTGEVMGIGETMGEAFAKAQAACGASLPTDGTVFISVNDADKRTILPVARRLHGMGFSIAATRGTARYLFENGLLPEVVLKVHEGSPNVVDHMRAGKIRMLINTPLGRHSQQSDKEIRIEAVRRKIPYTTTTSAAEAAVEGISFLKEGALRVRRL